MKYWDLKGCSKCLCFSIHLRCTVEKNPAFVKADHYDDVVFLGSSFCTGHTGVTLIYFAHLIDIVHVNSVWAMQ